MLHLVADSNQALGRLDGAAHMLPDPDLFVQMYMRKEAVLSSEIEGTQASLTDLLEYESASESRRNRFASVAEVFNYVRAMNHGLDRLNELPLSNRLLREIHGMLMENVRGGNKQPGEFRTNQNWVGTPGSPIELAMYVPPPVDEMKKSIEALEIFMNDDETYPPLIKIGLMHAQFETIHPFSDGNGRMGRLLITFFLCNQGVLTRPLLYLSAFLRENQSEYYERLQAVRDFGDWEGWLKFFLKAVRQVSNEACKKSEKNNRNAGRTS